MFAATVQGEYPPVGIKGRARSFLEKRPLLTLSSGLIHGCSLKLSICLTCETSPAGLPLICPQAPSPLPHLPPIHFHSHHVVLTPSLLFDCFCPARLPPPLLSNCQFAGHSPFSKAICPRPLVLTLTP